MTTISAEVVEARIKKYGRLWTIDDLIRVRAQDEVQSPVIGYPRYQSKPTDYEYFTGKDLDRMVDETCHLLVRDGLKVNSYKTVALFAQSDLSFVITFFALFRLGCKVLLISIRLGEPACLNLLATAECDTIMYGTTARIKTTIADLEKANASLNFMPMPSRQDYDRPDRPRPEPFFRPIADKEAEHVQVSLIAHSSGSTGLPKPLFLSHRSIINSIPTGTGLRAFNALPWYHIHGLFTSLMAMWMRQPAHMFNADLPLTAENLILALKEARPEICHCVPYTLKLMAERNDGIEVLRRCKYVTSAGARTPDELGDKLVKAGVKLGVIYGMTEVGHVGDSIYREAGDDSWDYVRPYASLRPHMMFKLRGGGGHVGGGGGSNVYEAVYLKSHPALKMSNSDNPPGSFHSRDLWTPHPVLPDAWKYVARDDDTVTLLSGEKILPLGIEGAIRESPFVRDALVVGNDRLTPGVLVFRAATGPDRRRSLSDAEFVDSIWPYVQAGNQLADEFARITRDMVVPVPADVSYPATDKNNIIRGAAYAQFQDYIDAMYAERPLQQQQTNGDKPSHKKKKLGVEELEGLIRDLLRDQAGIDMPDVHADFFAAGLDSLRAAQIRRLLLQSVDLGGRSLPTNAVYDAGNVAELARRLHAMSMGEATVTNGHITTQSDYTPTNGGSDISDLRLMQQMIDEYGTFERRKPGRLPRPEKETVILTGATGALGAHILHQLLQDPKVGKIYCLVRSSDSDSPEPPQPASKPPSADAASPPPSPSSSSSKTPPNLGLSPSPEEVFTALQATTTLIVHAAWPVNFHLGLASFRPQLAGLRRLLDLAAAVPFRRPARLLFTSSIAAAFGMPRGSRVPEGPLAELRYAAPTGYARSKLVGERICERAAAAAMATVSDEDKGSYTHKENPVESAGLNPFLSVFRFILGWGAGGDKGRSASRSAAAPATTPPPHVAVLRVGQISADTDHGIWNAKEAIPRLVQSAAQVGALPRLRERQGGTVRVDACGHRGTRDTGVGYAYERSLIAINGSFKSKMPILPSYSYPHQSIRGGAEDTNVVRLEKVVIRIDSGDNDRHTSNNDKSATTSTATALFYNLVAPHHFSWNDDFLPAVRASGLLRFDEVDLPEWLARLRTRAVELGAEAEARLPAIQLVDYYEATYMEGKDSGAKEGNSSLAWDVGKACAHSEAVRNCPQVVEAGLVPKMVRNWLAADDGEYYVRKG
ncbi:hypothetical protein PG995_007847 [Apiospora arundinis]